MRTVVVYESMYGNTHLVAEAIGQGLAPVTDVTVVPVEAADAPMLEQADLVVVGGPTHVRGMTRESTRRAAVEAARKPESDIELDPDAEGPGLRDWFDQLGSITAKAAAFDTRIHMTPVITGRASKGISKRLRKHGLEEVAQPESFFVTKDNHLEPDEAARAQSWGEQLAASLEAHAKN